MWQSTVSWALASCAMLFVFGIVPYLLGPKVDRGVQTNDRHPGEGRDPRHDSVDGAGSWQRKPTWFPAFAGMTF